MTTRAGRLRHWVTVRRPQQVQDTKGGYTTAWTQIARFKADIEGLAGREAMLADTLQGISAYRITARWRAGIRPSDQATLPDGTVLNIASATDPDGRRRDLVIMADTGSPRSEA